jgi:hypothetical protein
MQRTTGIARRMARPWPSPNMHAKTGKIAVANNSGFGNAVAFLQQGLPQILLRPEIHADAYRHDKTGSERKSSKTISRTIGALWFDRSGVYFVCRNGLGRSRIRTRCNPGAGKPLLWCSPLCGWRAYRDVEAVL